jgi:hypothetical protein
MNKLLLLLSALVFLIGCKDEKPENTTEFFPVTDYLKSQVKHVDTSLYRIIKIESANGRSDTSFLKREEFSKIARDFVEIPDIAAKKIKNDYEETQMYDESLQSIILTYTTSERENKVQRQDVILGQANEDGNSDVSTIIVHTMENSKKTSIEKNMVWYVNKRFIIVTKTNTANQPEKIEKLEVIWNGPGSYSQL